MNFFQKLFGGKDEAKEETKVQNEAKDFDVLKYDGVRAMKTGEVDYAIRCFKHALEIQEDLEIHDYLSVSYQRLTTNYKYSAKPNPIISKSIFAWLTLPS